MIVGWSTPDGRAGGHRGVREARESGLWFFDILFFLILACWLVRELEVVCLFWSGRVRLILIPLMSEGEGGRERIISMDRGHRVGEGRVSLCFLHV